jgi:L-threonylcarbamoyladenylate synthase
MYRYAPKLLAKVRRHLAGGGIIAYPTESCYGFGCDPFQHKAIAKILKIKGRSKTKGLIVIAGAEHQLNSIIQPLSPSERMEISKYWPGPFSLILPSTTKVPCNLIGRHSSIAVRITRHQLVQQLCRNLDSALVSTSANHAGHRSCRNYRETMRQFGSQVMVLPGLTNFAKKPSTLIDWFSKQQLR